MDAWAERYAGRANFVCVGCSGPQLSKEMGSRMRLKSCTNTFIETESEMPRWGQLGCNGFIVLAADGTVAHPCTSAFLKVKEHAFRHVEAVVDSLLAGSPVPSPCPGEVVRVGGRGWRAASRGQTALCVNAVDPADGMCEVMTQSGKRMRVPAADVAVVSDGDAHAEAEAGTGGSMREGAADVAD